MLALCAALGEPQTSYPTIHIAGTNGKGSVASMIAAALQSAGYRTGLYTSPHLVCFTERIKINGIAIPKDFAADFAAKINTLIEKLQPSFFEVATAMAFYYFAHERIDAAVIETGLGGRLDSTNIIFPMVSVITRIARDHCALLGNTLPEIAAEKAGIIKENIPIVIGKWQSECHEVFDNKAKIMNSPLVYASNQYKVVEPYSPSLNQFTIENPSGNALVLTPDLHGEWQGENLCTALCALKIIGKRMHIPDDALHYGLCNAAALTGLRGRWEILRRNPLIIADIAHNPDAIACSLRRLLQQPCRMLRIIFGIAADKDVDAVISLLPQNAYYYYTNAKNPRSMPADILAQKCNSAGLHGIITNNIAHVCRISIQDAAADDIIYICGSAMVVGEFLENYTQLIPHPPV
jgi:dihydrofolate synthase/folylpolyglutamate synthase